MSGIKLKSIFITILNLILLVLCVSITTVLSQTPKPTATATPQEITDPEIKDFDEKSKLLQKLSGEASKLLNSDNASDWELGKAKAQETINLSKELFEKLEKSDNPQKFAPKVENAKIVFQLLLKQSDTIAYQRLGDYYWKNKDWLKSIEYLQLAIQISRQTLANEKFKSSILYDDSVFTLLLAEETSASRIALILIYRLEKPREAIPYIEKSVKVSQKLQENQKGKNETVVYFKFNEAASLEIKASAYRKLNDRLQSIEISKQALAIYQSLPIPKDSQIRVLSFIGSTYFDLFDYENALKFFGDALKLAEETKNRQQQESVSTFLGIVYASLNNEKKSKELFLKNLDYALSSEFVEAMKNNTLLIPVPQEFQKGNSESKKGFSDKQAKFFQFYDVAGKYFGLQEYDKSISYARKALELADSVDHFSIKPSLIRLIARAYLKKEDWQNALKVYQELAEQNSKLAAKTEYAFDLANLSFAYLKMNQFENAEKHALQALNIFQSLGANKENIDFGYSHTLDFLSQIQNAKGNHGLAIFYGKQTVNAIQKERQQLKNLDAESQSDYLKKNEKPYRRLAGWLIAEGRIAEAEEVLQMLKEDELSEFLRRDDKVARELLVNTPLNKEEREALQKFDEIADEITKIAKKIEILEAESKKYDLPEDFPQRAELKDLEEKLATANTTFRKFLEDLSSKYFVKKTKTENNPIEVVSATQSLLNDIKQPKTVIISTIIEDNRLNLIFSTSKINRAHTVDISEEKLNELVGEFRQALQNPKIDPRPLGKKLYDILFPESLRKDLAGIEANTIVWSLDGTLRYVPMAALWDGEKYLVERYNQSVITLASRQNVKDTPTARTNLTALGVGVSKEANITNLAGEPRKFPALPAVPEELCSIVKDEAKSVFCNQYKTEGIVFGRNLLDEQFTFENFSFLLGRYPIVHIASHFDLNAGNEGTSYLLLGGENNAERKLTLAQLRDKIGSKLQSTEILTLSACDTGMSAGTKSNGEEIESFGAIAQTLGAKSVISSLWAVADPSTRDLMTEFYRQLQTNPKIGKGAAMRNAQIALLNGKYKSGETPVWRGAILAGAKQNDQSPFKKDENAPFAHPYYWSPFVLIGNWK